MVADVNELLADAVVVWLFEAAVVAAEAVEPSLSPSASVPAVAVDAVVDGVPVFPEPSSIFSNAASPPPP